MTGLEVLLFAGVVYAVAAPDRLTLSVTRGLVGAARSGWSAGRTALSSGDPGGKGRGAGARRTRDTSTTSTSAGRPKPSRPTAGTLGATPPRPPRKRSGGSKETPPDGPDAAPDSERPARGAGRGVAGSALAGAWAGARAAAVSARQSRAAGTDWTSRSTRGAVRAARVAGRQARTAGQHVAAATVRGGATGRAFARTAVRGTGPWTVRLRRAVKVAARVRRASRVGTAPPDQPRTGAAPGTNEPAGTGTTGPGTTQDPGPVAGPEATPVPGPDQNTGPAPAGPDHSTTTKGPTMDVTGLTGDIADLASLRAQVVAAQSTLDALIDATRTIRKWSADLPDKWDDAPFETRALNLQVVSIHEALGTLGGLDDAADALAAMRTAIREAEGLGERADELGAKGTVQAFTAA